MFSITGKKIWVTGHKGMVGSALVRRLEQEDCQILTTDRRGVDLTRQEAVEKWVEENRPDAIIIAAAKVGGIHANNTYPADFLYDNLMIESNIIHAAFKAKTEKLLFLGSSCIYPKMAEQPIREESLLTGALEPTNEWYAIAKIAGIKLCQAYRKQHGCDFISAMPTNLYGPGDNFHPDNAHVPAALLSRFHQAKEEGAPSVTVWGTGTPLREFMFVDDLADALVFLLKHYCDNAHINVGSGQEISIAGFARLIKETTGYQGELVFDTDKPDGTPRKLMDSTRLQAMGWKPHTPLEQGLKLYYEWFLAHQESLRQS